MLVCPVFLIAVMILGLTVKVKTGTPSKNSMFVKKSTVSTTGNTFKFNFKAPDDTEDNIHITGTLCRKMKRKI